MNVTCGVCNKVVPKAGCFQDGFLYICSVQCIDTLEDVRFRTRHRNSLYWINRRQEND